jgi:RNA polymerase sigma-70 factor (ECF subfamily)
MVGDEALAADLTQEVFLRVMRAAKSYDHRGRLRQWLFTIAANLVTDHARWLKRRREVLVEEPAGIDTGVRETTHALPQERQASAELREVVQRGVDQLPPKQRSVLLMRQYAGLAFKEIAALEGCSINTALSRMRYALGNLRKILADKFEVAQKDELRRS